MIKMRNAVIFKLDTGKVWKYNLVKLATKNVAEHKTQTDPLIVAEDFHRTRNMEFSKNLEEAQETDI